MTFNQIVFDLLMISGGGRHGQDDRYEEGQIAFWVNRARADIITSIIEKRTNQFIDPVWYQPLNHIELNQTDLNASEFIGEPDGCMIHHGLVPTPLDVHGNILFNLKWQNRLSSVPIVHQDRVKYFKHSRWVKSYGFISNTSGYPDMVDLFVVNPMNQDQDKLYMSGSIVALDPTKVNRFISVSNVMTEVPFDKEKDQYPLNGPEINKLIQRVSYYDMRISRQEMLDLINNMSDDDAQSVLRVLKDQESPYSSLNRGGRGRQRYSGGGGGGIEPPA